jgi:hypothetical protein
LDLIASVKLTDRKRVRLNGQRETRVLLSTYIRMHELAAWDSFYVIVGSAAGALIGLQFVVMTLINQRPANAGPEVGAAFSTPTVIHFGVVLFLSALSRVPWESMTPGAIICGAMGGGGILYILFVTWRIRGQNAYEPVGEDWLFHCVLPLVAYATLAVSALYATSSTHTAFVATAAAALLLLLIGIHNAWDTVMWHVFTVPKKDKEAGNEETDAG